MRSGRVMDRGYLGDVGRHTKPLGSAAVGPPEECAGYVIWATRETGGGNCGHESMKSGLLYCEDEEALLGAVQCVPSTLNLQ